MQNCEERICTRAVLKPRFAAGIVTSYGAGRPRSWSSHFCTFEKSDILPLEALLTKPIFLIKLVLGAPYSGVKAPEREADHLQPTGSIKRGSMHLLSHTSS
jgi:hypothetical protein